MQPELKEEISIYRGILTSQCIAHEIEKIQVSFPTLSETFFNILGERLVINKFNDARLKAAIGFVIDNFKYNTPKIADIIGFDKCVKIYRYDDVLEALDKGKTWNYYSKIRKNGKLYYVKTTDKEQFNLSDEL